MDFNDFKWILMNFIDFEWIFINLSNGVGRIPGVPRGSRRHVKDLKFSLKVGLL